MAKPSDREYALQRKIKDLEQKNRNLELELTQLKKKLEKMEQPEFVTKGKKAPLPKETSCPKCEAKVKESALPFGTLRICANACGWREVKK